MDMAYLWFFLCVVCILIIFFGLFVDSKEEDRGKPMSIKDLPEGTVFRVINPPNTTTFVFFVKDGESHIRLVQFPQGVSLKPGQDFVVVDDSRGIRLAILPTATIKTS